MALEQAFSCKFYEISTNSFFIEHLLVTASWKIIPYKQIRISLKVDQFDKTWRSDTFLPWELFNNYVILKLSFFNPPHPYHHGSSRMITRPPSRYVTSDIDTPPLLYQLFLFFQVKKTQRCALTHDTSTHVFKQLNQIVRFK